MSGRENGGRDGSGDDGEGTGDSGAFDRPPGLPWMRLKSSGVDNARERRLARVWEDGVLEGGTI
jgi:hypothetical protein